MNKHSISKLKRALICSVPAVALVSASLGIFTSCVKQKDTTPVVKQNNSFCYQNETTFTVTNPSPNGYFQVKVNDNVIDTNNKMQIPFVHVSSKSNSQLTIQPIELPAKDQTFKYTIQYFNDSNEAIYDSSFYLNMETDFTLKVTSKNTYIHKFAPEVTITAIPNSSSSLPEDLSWSYDLLDKSATSYLEYFNVTETSNSTKLTLKKGTVESNTNIWIWAKCSKGKVGIQVPILKYIPPIVVPNSTSVEINKISITTIDLNFLKGSYTGTGLSVGWNLFTGEGEPLNILKQDFTDPVTGITYPEGTQVPLTNSSIKYWKEHPTELYGKDSLEFLLGNNESKYSTLGVFDGQKTVKDEILKLQVQSAWVSPKTKKIQVQAQTYSPLAYSGTDQIVPNSKYLLSTSTNRAFDFDSPTYILTKNEDYKIDLYSSKYVDGTKTESTDLADYSGVIFNVAGLNNPSEYTYKFSKFQGFPSEHINYKTGISDDNPVVEHDITDQTIINAEEGKHLFGSLPSSEAECLAVGSNCPELFFINKTNVDLWHDKHQTEIAKSVKLQQLETQLRKYITEESTTGFWFVSATLLNSLYLPINDKTFSAEKSVDETRDIEVSISVNIYPKGKESESPVLSVPIFFNILNANRVISLKNLDFLADSTTNTIDIKKVAAKNDGNSTAYQNELYVPSEINGKAITNILRSSKLTEANFFSKIRHITFEKNSNIKVINSGALVDPETSATTGAFAHFTNLRSVDFTNCQVLTTIGDYAFYGMNTEASFFNNVVLPASIQDTKDTQGNKINAIGAYAFQRTPIQIISLEGTDKNVSLGTYAFDSCSQLTQFIGSSRIINVDVQCFSNCGNLNAFNFSSCQSIGNHAFQNCTSLTNIDLSNNTNAKIFNMQDTGNFIFSFDATGSTKVSINLLLGDKTNLLVKPSSSEDFFNIFGGPSGASCLIAAATSNTTISNLSCHYDIYKSQFSPESSPGLTIKKLNIYNFEQSTTGISLLSSIEDLTLTDCKLKDKFLNNSTDTSSATKLKFLTFKSTGQGNFSVDKDITNLFTANLSSGVNPINQIQAFTFIAPPMSDEYGGTNYKYAIQVLKDFFQFDDSVDPETKTTNYYNKFFSEFSQTAILTINIKMSFGDPTDTTLSTSTFTKVKEELYKDPQGIAYKKSDGTYDIRVNAQSFDMNTCINWILWDE